MRKVIFAILIVVGAGMINLVSSPAFAGGTLNTTITATPESLDPAVGKAENDWKVYVNLYDFLVYPAFKDASPEPGLAEKWEVAGDDMTWTFHLRKGVKFHDGSELTAEDVKFSMDRLIAIGEGYSWLFRDRVKETIAIDPQTVIIKLKEPFGPFLVTLYRLAVVNKKLVETNFKKDGRFGDKGDYGKDYLLNHDAGSGPYRVDVFKIRNVVEMVKYPDYWKGVPAAAPDRVITTQLREAATTKMMMGSGKIDLAHGHQELTTNKALDAMEHVELASIPEMSLNFFMINTKKAPTDDIHIRKAMAYATDYKAMRKVYPGSAEVCTPVPPQVFGWTDRVNCYQLDLAKAKAELKKSKYWGKLNKHPVDVSYIKGNGDTPKLCMLFAANMAKIGIKVNIVEAPWVLFQNKAESIETSSHVTNLFCDTSYPEAGAILELKYASWTVGGWNQNEWLQDARFDGMIKDALKIVDPKKRAVKYAEIQKYIVEDLCPSLYAFGNVLNPAYRIDRFSWPAGDGKSHALTEFNFNYSYFKMK